jgi:hypothetical protein
MHPLTPRVSLAISDGNLMLFVSPKPRPILSGLSGLARVTIDTLDETEASERVNEAITAYEEGTDRWSFAVFLGYNLILERYEYLLRDIPVQPTHTCMVGLYRVEGEEFVLLSRSEACLVHVVANEPYMPRTCTVQERDDVVAGRVRLRCEDGMWTVDGESGSGWSVAGSEDKGQADGEDATGAAQTLILVDMYRLRTTVAQVG